MKITKTMRYEISFNKELYDILGEIQHAIFRIKNKAVSMAWDWQMFSFGYNERFGVYPKAKDVTGKSLAQDIYAEVKESFGEYIASSTVDASNQEAIKKFELEKPEILSGRKSIQQYKREGSFPVRASQIKDLRRTTSKKYDVSLSLLSRKGAKELGTSTQIPAELRTGKGANLILDRIISGEYKLCDSRISKRKNKYYLLVTYQFEKEAVTLDTSRVVGIDLGIVNAAYLATNFAPYERFVIEGGEIAAFRKRVEERRKSMLRQTKYCGNGRRGRGRKTLLKPTDKLRSKVEDFRRTTNHKYSKAIVEFAEKHGCGVIQMEDLSGISHGDKFLRNWSYFELQSFIEYKARERGIEFRKVSARHTSKRCSNCGHIAGGNRETQAKFSCKRCGYEANADFNAARNIAQPDIEDRIRAEEERQKHEKVALLAE